MVVGCANLAKKEMRRSVMVWVRGQLARDRREWRVSLHIAAALIWANIQFYGWQLQTFRVTLPHFASLARQRWRQPNSHDENPPQTTAAGSETEPESRVKNWANYITGRCQNCDNTETMNTARRNGSTGGPAPYGNWQSVFSYFSKPTHFCNMPFLISRLPTVWAFGLPRNYGDAGE